MSKHHQARPHPAETTVVEGHPRLYVMVGLPAAGKTTLARRIEIEHRALRFTPDEWMIPLFGESMANGKRNVLEGRFIATALSALRLGVNVVLDFGVWAKDERTEKEASENGPAEGFYEAPERQHRFVITSKAESCDALPECSNNADEAKDQDPDRVRAHRNAVPACSRNRSTRRT